MTLIIKTPQEASEAACALAKWSREQVCDQEFEDLDVLEEYMASAVIAQVTDPDYNTASEIAEENS